MVPRIQDATVTNKLKYVGLSRVGLLLLDVLCKAWQGRLRYSNFFFPEKFCIFASRNKKETERLEKLKILPDCFSIQIVKHKNKKFLLLLQGPPIVKASGWTKLAAAAASKSLQSCPTLWDPTDGSPPGSPIPGTKLTSCKYFQLNKRG